MEGTTAYIRPSHFEWLPDQATRRVMDPQNREPFWERSLLAPYLALGLANENSRSLDQPLLKPSNRRIQRKGEDNAAWGQCGHSTKCLLCDAIRRRVHQLHHHDHDIATINFTVRWRRRDLDSTAYEHLMATSNKEI